MLNHGGLNIYTRIKYNSQNLGVFYSLIWDITEIPYYAYLVNMIKFIESLSLALYSSKIIIKLKIPYMYSI
ncbi:MAG: hypothetical protein K0R49_1456 [Burkholderiales bacterium]|nr:hypothetical protein [Burkholderiales bacterium]